MLLYLKNKIKRNWTKTKIVEEAFHKPASMNNGNLKYRAGLHLYYFIQNIDRLFFSIFSFSNWINFPWINQFICVLIEQVSIAITHGQNTWMAKQTLQNESLSLLNIMLTIGCHYL